MRVKRRYAVIGAAIVMALAIGFLVREAVRPRIESVAVLPFQNMSADSEYDYLAEWLAEELITKLCSVEDLGVSSRTSSFYFKKNVMEKGCALTVKRIYLKDAKAGSVLIDDIASFANETPMIKEIGEYSHGQISLSKYPF